MQEEENNNSSKRKWTNALEELVRKEKKRREETNMDKMVKLQNEFEKLICSDGYWAILLPPIVTVEKLAPLTRIAKKARELSVHNRSTWLLHSLWSFRNHWKGWFDILETLDDESSLLSLEAR